MKASQQNIINLLIIILGNFALAFSTSIFILPHDIVNGGTSGLGIVLEGFFGFKPEIVIIRLLYQQGKLKKKITEDTKPRIKMAITFLSIE